MFGLHTRQKKKRPVKEIIPLLITHIAKPAQDSSFEAKTARIKHR
jgi:hypothetical protein